MTIRLASVIALILLALSSLTARATTSSPSLLPAGYLSTSGSQIVDANGHDVRLSCTGYVNPTSGTVADIHNMALYGFNCVRVSWYDATLAANLKTIDAVVAAAKTYGLKVIIDHHGDETPSAKNCWLPYPGNGLPIDKGNGTDNTDGVIDGTINGKPCGTVADTGTVTLAKYEADWVTVAKHYAGNSTVIGFDLTNEPHLAPKNAKPTGGGATWNYGGATDLRVIYGDVGRMIQAVNPGPLIIAEGILNFTGKLMNGAANPISGYPDLSEAGLYPVILTVNHKLVYSLHDYPNTIGSTTPDSGDAKIKAMNTEWGFLVTRHRYPVWIGEMGASLDGLGPDSNKPAMLADEKNWAATLLVYLNGQDGALGGPVFSGCQQPVGTDWWAWGNLDGQAPDGTLNDAQKPRPYQRSVTAQLEFLPHSGC